MNRSIILAAGGGVAAAALITVGVLAAVHDGPSPAGAQSPTPTGSATAVTRTITVDGVGVVSGTPDTANLSLGVQVQAATATEALDDASTKSEALVDTLTAAGVGKADIQTSGLNLYPNDTGRGTVNGYTAGSSVSATLHEFDPLVSGMLVTVFGPKSLGPKSRMVEKLGLVQVTVTFHATPGGTAPSVSFCTCSDPVSGAL